MKNNNVVLIGIAGAVAIISLEIFTSKLNLLELLQATNKEKLEIVFLALSTFGVYVLTFKIANFVDNNFLWRLYQPVLSGKWKLHLIKLEDNTTQLDEDINKIREGEVTIFQTRDQILLTAIHRRPREEYHFSTWESINSTLKRNELIFSWESRSSQNSLPIKRGRMELTIMSKFPKKLTGHYYDDVPSKSRGIITLTKV